MKLALEPTLRKVANREHQLGFDIPELRGIKQNAIAKGVSFYHRLVIS
jgi:hypothetical protein